MHINRVAVRKDGRLDLEGDADVALIKRGRRGGRDGEIAAAAAAAEEAAAAADAADAAADAAAAEGLRNLRRGEFCRISELADDLDFRDLGALGGHAGSREEVNSLLLVQSAHDELECRIGAGSDERCDAGREQAAGSGAGEQGVNDTSGDGGAAASVSSSHRSISDIRREGEVLPVKRISGSGCSAAGEYTEVPRDVRLAEHPVEAQFLEVVLRDFDEFRLNLDLLRTAFGLADFDDFFDEVEVVLGVLDDERAARLAVHRHRAWREGDAIRDEPVPCTGLNACRWVRRRCSEAASRCGSCSTTTDARRLRDHIRRNLPLLREELLGLRTERDDVHRERLDLVLQVREVGDVFDDLDERDIVQRERDSRAASTTAAAGNGGYAGDAAGSGSFESGDAGGRGRGRGRGSRTTAAFIAEAQDDVHALAFLIKLLRLVHEEFDRLAHGCVAEINFWEPDVVQLRADGDRARGRGRPGRDDVLDLAIEALGRAVPFLFDFPQRDGARGVVAGARGTHLHVRDFLPAIARGLIVGIAGDDFLIFPIGEIVTPQVGVAFCLDEELFDILDICPVLGRHLLVEIIRRLDVLEQPRSGVDNIRAGRAIRGILPQYFLQDLHGERVVAFRHALLGEFDARELDAVLGRLAALRRRRCAGCDAVARVLEVREGRLVILFAKRLIALLHRIAGAVFARDAADHLAVCSGIHGFAGEILRPHRCGLDEHASDEQRCDACGERGAIHVGWGLGLDLLGFLLEKKCCGVSGEKGWFVSPATGSGSRFSWFRRAVRCPPHSPGFSEPCRSYPSRVRA